MILLARTSDRVVLLNWYIRTKWLTAGKVNCMQILEKICSWSSCKYLLFFIHLDFATRNVKTSSAWVTPSTNNLRHSSASGNNHSLPWQTIAALNASNGNISNINNNNIYNKLLYGIRSTPHTSTIVKGRNVSHNIIYKTDHIADGLLDGSHRPLAATHGARDSSVPRQ